MRNKVVSKIVKEYMYKYNFSFSNIVQNFVVFVLSSAPH